MKITAYSWVSSSEVEFNAGVRLVGKRYAAKRSDIRKAFEVPADGEYHSSIVPYIIVNDADFKGHPFSGDVKRIKGEIFIGCMQFKGINYKRLKRWATAKKSQKSSK